MSILPGLPVRGWAVRPAPDHQCDRRSVHRPPQRHDRAPPGADWLGWILPARHPSNVQDSRRSADHVQYFGLLEMTPGIKAILGGGDTPTNFGEQYFFIDPRMETGDKRYSWVNQTIFIAQDRVLPGPRVEYRVSRLANS